MSFGCNERGGVNFWRYAQHELAGSWFFGCLALLLANVYIVVYCCMKISSQLGHSCTVKSNDVPHTQHSTDKYIIVRVKFDAGGISLVCHGVVHGFVPCRSKNSLAFST